MKKNLYLFMIFIISLVINLIPTGLFSLFGTYLIQVPIKVELSMVLGFFWILGSIHFGFSQKKTDILNLDIILSFIVFIFMIIIVFFVFDLSLVTMYQYIFHDHKVNNPDLYKVAFTLLSYQFFDVTIVNYVFFRNKKDIENTQTEESIDIQDQLDELTITHNNLVSKYNKLESDSKTELDLKQIRISNLVNEVAHYKRTST